MTATWMDRFGSAASLACALHCGVFAFAPAVVALVGIESLGNEVVEWGFFGLALTFAIVAAALGYRVHRTRWVLLGFATGGTLLVVARLAEALSLFEGGALLAVLGGLIVASFHVVNTQRLRASSAVCCAT